MKRRALNGRPLFRGGLSQQGAAALLALGVTAVLLTAGLISAADRLPGRLSEGGEEPAPVTAAEEAAAQPAPAPAQEELAPVLAEDDPPAGLSQTEAEAEDGEQPELTPKIDLHRLANGTPAIIRPYGYDYNPNTEDYRFHRGSDLAAAAGQPVFAPAEGTVREATEDAYWGGILIIDHEGWTTVLRCVTPRVEVGERVLAGDFIASVCPAPAEAAEESHFHVEVEREGQSLDPALYF